MDVARIRRTDALSCRQRLRAVYTFTERINRVRSNLLSGYRVGLRNFYAPFRSGEDRFRIESLKILVVPFCFCSICLCGSQEEDVLLNFVERAKEHACFLHVAGIDQH